MTIKARRAHLPPRTKRGRPPGTILETTKIQRAAKASFNMLASHSARRILESQLFQALGTYHVIELIRDEKNHSIILERKIVRETKRIEDFLSNGEFEYGYHFIIVEGTPGDFRAGDSILNRAWGKPKETLEVEGDVKFSMKALHMHAQKMVQGEVIEHDALDADASRNVALETSRAIEGDVSSAPHEAPAEAHPASSAHDAAPNHAEQQ